jgi:glycosyltransferase involved in cell wall biosynthesis
VPEGVEIPAAQVDTVTARQRLGINYNGTLFLFFGNLRRDKGLEDLLQATALVSYLADYSTEELTGMIRQLGLENKVLTRFEFISDEEMNLYAYASDAVIFPYRSSYKGGVCPLRKVRACGRPTIVTAVAEMGRITQLYNMGIVVEPDNPLSIAGGISRFIGMSSEERTKLANNALRFAEENTWRIMAAKYTELFDQVVHS